MLDFDRLQTPPGDGEILIEPPLEDWPGLIAENISRRREWRFTLAGQPADAVLKQTRALLHDTPLIAGGHQPAFVHPGVWAKHVVIHHAAVRFGVHGTDLVVDHDAPRSAGLPVPFEQTDGLVCQRGIAFTSAPAGSAYEGRPGLSCTDIDRIRRELHEGLGARWTGSQMPAYLDGFAGVPEPRDAVHQHLAGRLRLDTQYQADLAEARVSDVFGGLFLADLLLNPEPFAVVYNQALARYRKEQDVRSPDRPLPDLHRAEGRTETPLWIYQPLQPRRRLWVCRASEQVDLFADQARVAVLPARELTREPDATLSLIRPWVIRPRALTLTLWARLLACDLFVHGIGGAKYDRITDEIIRQHYRCAPPAFACVSATLRLPLPRFGTGREEVRSARRQRRDWRFNPQRYLAGTPTDLVEERARMIALSTRLREARAPRAQRRDVHHAIQACNDRLTRLDPTREAGLLVRIERLERELESDAVASSREYFYALQPAGRLASLADRLRRHR